VSNRFLTREDILRAEDIPQEVVEVPEWGGCVRLRGLTGDERDSFEASIIVGRGANRQVNWRNLRSKLVALSIVDEAGQRMFTDADVDVLGRKSAVALERLFEVAARLSGLGRQDMEELTKNSNSDRSDDFISV
jgi:hypothetical protein